MRIWDIPPSILCRNHLLGEHQEIHSLWTVINKNKKGYSNHPETHRWRGKLKALFLRHEKVAKEMRKRGYKHLSHLDAELAKGSAVQDAFINSVKEQKEILKSKKCLCKI